LVPNPIRKVLSLTRFYNVASLLMGGQACVCYGAAEFSRDTDLAIFASPENLGRLAGALRQLRAKRIALPAFRQAHLEHGHAIHFRCHHQDVAGVRLDVMSVMRGLDAFPFLWERRTTMMLADAEAVDLLSLPDLVRAKKTQRDKDWPMIGRLLEAHYFENRERPSNAKIQFWLKELRTPELIVEVAYTYPELRAEAESSRPLLRLALDPARLDELRTALLTEAEEEKQRDRIYWQPLKEELEVMRHARHPEVDEFALTI